MAEKLVLREFTSDNIIGDYRLLKIAVAELEEYHFKDMTPQQLEREKRDLIQELKLDTVFKLLTKFAKNCSVLTGYFTHIRHWYAHGRYFKRYHPTVIPDPEALGIIYHQFETLVFARTK